MNIYGSLWGITAQRLSDPTVNIGFGSILLKLIQNNLPPNASVAQIATLYNKLGASEVTDYGARVQKVYNEKSWEKNYYY